MDINIFQRFLAVVSCGSLSKAAQKLNVSQPALSKSIQQLEQFYGVTLLSRGAQGIAPTEHGEYLLQRFKLLENEMRHISEEMDAIGGQARRRVAVGAPPGLGNVSNVLTHAIIVLSSGPAPVLIEVRIGGKGQLLPLLANGDLDLLIAEIATDRQQPDLQHEVLFDDFHVLAIRQDHPLRRLKQISIADVMSYPWIISRDSQIVADSLIKYCLDQGMQTGTMPVVRSDSSLFIGSVVANSDFVAIATSDSLSLGSLEAELYTFWVTDDDVAMKQVARQIGVIYRSEAFLTPAALSMLRELRKTKRLA